MILSPPVSVLDTMPTMTAVKAVLLDVPQSLLDERRRLGIDVFDECWEGVLHLVPPPRKDHQNIAGDLQIILGLRARTLGLRSTPETGYYAADDDWRVPDLIVAADDVCSERGVEGAAALVVEIRSPHDETDAKLAWYAARGADEILIVDPDTRTVELYITRDLALVMIQPDGDGIIRLGLGVALRTIDTPDGARLEATVGDETTLI